MSLKITEPQNEAELLAQKEITFRGTADSNINKVEIYADDRWLLGRTQTDSGKWSLSYPFNTAGHREIVAKGFDSDNQLIASDEIWIFLKKAPIDLTIQLTANFQLWEFVKSGTADRHNIDNTPTPREIENIQKLCKQIIQPARDALGPLKITSGFRSSALNKFVGGASNSDHRQGYAADIIPVNVRTKTFAAWVAKNCKFDQVILEFGTLENPNWIHVSAAPRNRGEVLRATSGINGTTYTRITL
ncbi:MAG: D-Ala-D-Ala carboxypeptidase family metallohydrolase [Desertifilum sp.]|nr:D-Ala-D-Ala carboxypeptidase family metallohydrolase [Desertifilum sp.]